MRNQRLTLALALLWLALPCWGFEGSLSSELTAGNRTLTASLVADWGIVPERFYLVGTYGVVRHAPDPSVSSRPSHQFGLGVDYLSVIGLLSSLSVTFSPWASDVSTIPDRPALTLLSSRRSAQGIVGLSYQSQGLTDWEWAADLGFIGAWYELGTEVRLPLGQLERRTTLWLGRPSAGATLTLFSKTDLTVRGSLSLYSADPTQLGGPEPRFDAIGATQALNATAAFSAAPVWFDVRFTAVHRFNRIVTGRVAYTFTRYVHGIGNAHALSTRWSFKVAGWLRLWAGVATQYDQLSTSPSFGSGYGTLGAELSTE